jgi:hypothetical protein
MLKDIAVAMYARSEIRSSQTTEITLLSLIYLILVDLNL